MSSALAELVNIFTLEPIEEGIFRAPSQELHLPQLFGGQVLGQAVAAASLTVENTKSIHSIHGYFIRRGRASKPVLYQVESLRDGRSFGDRRYLELKACFGGRRDCCRCQSSQDIQDVVGAQAACFKYQRHRHQHGIEPGDGNSSQYLRHESVTIKV